MSVKRYILLLVSISDKKTDMRYERTNSPCGTGDEGVLASQTSNHD
jgi:hypothetical protein